MAHSVVLLSAATSLVVTAVALVLSAVAVRSLRKSGNPSLRFVAAVFAVFALKNLFSAYNVLTHVVPHDTIELVLSLFDLVIIGLLVAPLARRRRGQ